MSALISKPGITNASTLSIPKAWDAAWYRSFINSQLTGADVRNATSPTGTIKIGGTLASPYGTIDLNTAANITFTGDIILSPSSGVALTVNAASSNRGVIVHGVANQYAMQVTNVNTASQSFGLLIDAGTNISDVALLVQNAGGSNLFAVNGGGSPLIQGFGAIGGALVDMTPDSGTFTLTQTGGTTAPTVSATFSKQGNQVTLTVPVFAAMTSNSTGLTMTGIPAALQPTRAQYFTAPYATFINGGAQQTNNVSFEIIGGGALQCLINGSTTGWTNSATAKGLNNVGMTFTYMLN